MLVRAKTGYHDYMQRALEGIRNWHIEQGGTASIEVDCHSGGTTPIRDFIRNAPDHYRHDFVFCGMGVSSFLPEREGWLIKNYISKRDWVPLVADPLRYFRERLFEGNTRFLPVHEGACRFFDHFFDEPTYVCARRKFDKLFNKWRSAS